MKWSVAVEYRVVTAESGASVEFYQARCLDANCAWRSAGKEQEREAVADAKKHGAWHAKQHAKATA